MSVRRDPAWFLEQEARGLLARVDRLKPFVLHESMLPAALLLPRSLIGIEQTLLDGRRWLRREGRDFLAWLNGPGRAAGAPAQQRRFTLLRSAFNDHLAQLDLFSHAITQRSESELGVWLSGLDLAAADGLALPRLTSFRPPPVICYVERGSGAAIRRAATRLPGGVANPVALVRIPRERMIGHGIASSLMHEVGHQGAALLGLVDSLRSEFHQREQRAPTGPARVAWRCWRTWISEIVADLWSVSRLGPGSTLGLMAVVSFPPAVVYHVTLRDPHPLPWIRVLISSHIGEAMYPAPEWAQLRRTWTSLYPREQAPPRVRRLLAVLEREAPTLARALLDHRARGLGDARLGEVLAEPDREPRHLRALYESWTRRPALAHRASPTLHFAVIGQARLDGRISPEAEARQIDHLLTRWAMQTTLMMAAAHAEIEERSTRRPWQLARATA